MREARVLARREGWSDGISILIGQKDASTGRLVSTVRQLAIEPLVDGDYAEPTLTLHRNAAQALMDELWECGLRPTEGAGSAGALAATQKHLEDMRTLVFGPQSD